MLGKEHRKAHIGIDDAGGTRRAAPSESAHRAAQTGFLRVHHGPYTKTIAAACVLIPGEVLQLRWIEPVGPQQLHGFGTQDPLARQTQTPVCQGGEEFGVIGNACDDACAAAVIFLSQGIGHRLAGVAVVAFGTGAAAGCIFLRIFRAVRGDPQILVRCPQL